MLLGALRLQRGLDADAIAALCSGERFAPAPLSAAERERLANGRSGRRARAGRRRFPRLDRALARAQPSATTSCRSCRRFAARAPLDIRVNTLKVHAPRGAGRAPPSRRGRDAPLALRPAHQARRGRARAGPAGRAGVPARLVRDPGRGLAARRAARRRASRASRSSTSAPAPAARRSRSPPLMENGGQIYATDSRRPPSRADPRPPGPRRRPQRPGPHAARAADAVADLDGRADLVLVDAPCTGSGTWRRNPDAKWRLRPGSLEIAAEGAGGGARPGRPARPARRADRLRHLLGAAGGERRGGRGGAGTAPEPAPARRTRPRAGSRRLSRERCARPSTASR